MQLDGLRFARTAVAFVLSVCLASLLLGADNAGAGLTGQWQRAQVALGQRDFRAATALLASIEQAAVEEQEWGHAARAVAQHIELEASTNTVPSGLAALKLKDAASRAPLPMRAVLEVLAAHRFRSYAEHLFGGQGRDAPAVEGIPQQPEGLLNEIERCYQRAMVFEDVLKRIPIGMYGVLFDAGTVADALRPTLFDVIAYDLLEFYAWSREQKLDGSESVTLDPEGPALQDVTGFNFVIPDEAARRSRVLRALRLWQALLAFHADDEDPAAYADADLNRLQFCYPLVVGEKREERYCAALDRFAHKWRTHELSSRAFALRAQLAFDAGDAALARVVAQKGASAYPSSIGAAQCRNLIACIEAPSLALTAERVWCAPWPQFEIAYKNLTQLHFRVVRVPFDEAFVPRRTRQSTEDAPPVQWLARRPMKQWGMVLPPTGDYRIRSHRVSVPQDLPNGLYALFVSPDASFETGGAPIIWEMFRVSRLALVTDQKPDRVHGYVLTAREGEPVPAVRVTVWREQTEGGFKRERVMATENDGRFTVCGGRVGEIMILAERQDDAAQTWMPLWRGSARTRFEAPVTHATFVTDRDVCRSGQVVLPVVLDETAWHAQITADTWQTPLQSVRFEIDVQTLDGTAVVTSGELRVVQLKPPEWVKRPPLLLLDDSASGVCRVDNGEDPVEAWPELRTLGEERVQTGTNGIASGSVPLPVGVFRLAYETRDPAGRRVTARRNIRVFDPDARRLPFTVPVHIAAESWRVSAGDRFRAIWGSGYARASALMLAESDGLELLRMRTDPEVTQQRFELPVDTAARGGFWFRMLCVRENRAYTYERRVEVVRRDRNLSLAVEGLPPTGFQFQNHGVRLVRLCGSWRDDREPDAWRYRTWRTYAIDPQKTESHGGCHDAYFGVE